MSLLYRYLLSTSITCMGDRYTTTTAKYEVAQTFTFSIVVRDAQQRLVQQRFVCKPSSAPVMAKFADTCILITVINMLAITSDLMTLKIPTPITPLHPTPPQTPPPTSVHYFKCIELSLLFKWSSMRQIINIETKFFCILMKNIRIDGANLNRRLW